MTFYPDLMVFENGAPVTGAADWPKRREELLDILRREEYGYAPLPPAEVTAEVTEVDTVCASGHARLEYINLSFQAEKGGFCLPFKFFAPNDGERHPTVVLINFRPEPYDRSFPAEEILENGFALALVCYEDITKDDGDFSDKLAGLYSRPADGTGWGKISLWAFGVSRVVDYIQTRSEVDAEQIAVAGHSRLGKTALWCGAQDERVKFVLVNDSGCGGAALEQTKHEGGETIAVMAERFPYWFCENRSKYAQSTENMPFDQHFLVAAVAPRYVAIGSASLDAWADQYSEQLSAVAASPVWEILGRKGFIGPTDPASIGDAFGEGAVSYHLRDGIHFLGRGDWLHYMRFMKEHMNDGGDESV